MPDHQDIPVVQVSAPAVEAANSAHGLTHGADPYLIDPTEPEELLATVTASLRHYRPRQRAERTATLRTALTRVTLDINAAATFDGLVTATAAGAAHFQRPGRAAAGPAGRSAPPDVGRACPASAHPARRPGRTDGTYCRSAARLRRNQRCLPMERSDSLALVPDSSIRTDVGEARWLRACWLGNRAWSRPRLGSGVPKGGVAPDAGGASWAAAHVRQLTPLTAFWKAALTKAPGR